METLRQAVDAIQENLSALVIYLVITVGSQSMALFADSLLEPASHPYQDQSWLVYLGFRDLLVVVCVALAQAVVFSRLGKQIDRPLWKLEGDIEAIRRYFLLWFGLNAAVMATSEVANWAGSVLDDPRIGLGVLGVAAILSIIQVPTGAAVMFLGPFSWRKLGECLAPMVRQFPKTLVVFALNGLVFFLTLYLFAGTESNKWLRPAIPVIGAYFDCVIFAATWLICMYDRQNPEEPDLDF